MQVSVTNTLSKILICDDHPVSQLGIKCALEEVFPSREFTFHMANLGSDALKIAAKESIDLLILDLRLPDMSGLDVLKKLKKETSPIRVMILTGEENAHILIQLLRYDVQGILLKTYNLPMLKAALSFIEENADSTYLDPSLEKRLQAETDKQRLSPREFEVLELLLKGHTNKAIAEFLNCSPETVKVHRTKIREKTNLKSRDEISAWFHKGTEK